MSRLSGGALITGSLVQPVDDPVTLRIGEPPQQYRGDAVLGHASSSMRTLCPSRRYFTLAQW